jgi:hypothetical protein
VFRKEPAKLVMNCLNGRWAHTQKEDTLMFLLFKECYRSVPFVSSDEDAISTAGMFEESGI